MLDTIRARFYRGTKFGYARGVLSASTSGRAFMTAKCEQQQNQLALCSNLAAWESCWGVVFPKPCTSSQAPYPSPCRNRQGSLIPLLLLFPTNSYDFVGTPIKIIPTYQIDTLVFFMLKFYLRWLHFRHLMYCWSRSIAKKCTMKKSKTPWILCQTEKFWCLGKLF